MSRKYGADVPEKVAREGYVSKIISVNDAAERQLRTVPTHIYQILPQARLGLRFFNYFGRGTYYANEHERSRPPDTNVHPAEQIFYVIKGGPVCFTIDDKDFVVTEGEGVVIPSMCEHAGRNIGDEDAKIISVQAWPADIGQLTEIQKVVYDWYAAKTNNRAGSLYPSNYYKDPAKVAKMNSEALERKPKQSWLSK